MKNNSISTFEIPYLFLFKWCLGFRIKCEIETPQFYGDRNYTMFRQTGHYNLYSKKFSTDKKVKGSHDVWGFKNFNEFNKTVIKYL